MNEPLRIIAYIENDFPEKFGVPRQSGLAATVSRIVFAPPYRNPEALRGITDYSHLWLIWEFSEAFRKKPAPDDVADPKKSCTCAMPEKEPFHATVRPPRLGGDTRVGVFATRSPFRPNPIGLSVVKLLSVETNTPEGPVLTVEGADLISGTPIFDIKPYLPYVESIPDARGGFSDAVKEHALSVEFPDALLAQIPVLKRDALISVLSQDPRPPYQNDPKRIYGMSFGGFDIRFLVSGRVLTVVQVICLQPE